MMSLKEFSIHYLVNLVVFIIILPPHLLSFNTKKYAIVVVISNGYRKFSHLTSEIDE